MSTTNSDERTFLRKLLRKPLVNRQYHCEWIPRDPSDSWASIQPYWGYDHSSAELSGCAVYGMIKKVECPTQHGPSDYFALISLRAEHNAIPPHPGQGPDYLDDYAHPDLVFSDGSLGCWNPRYFPQLYDRRRPWIGYHALPQPSSDNRHTPENWSTVEYYDFSEARVPFTGGHWKISQIEALLKRRASVEADIFPLLVDIRDILLKHYGTFLPYFDPLTMETVREWKIWPDGRDSIGHTQRYIAELVALHRWLSAVKDSPPKSGIGSDVIGVWVGTISNDAEWALLRNSQLPLFSLVPVPPQHPYCEIAIIGDLDNGERNRINSLDFALNGTTKNVSQFRRQVHTPLHRTRPNYGTLPKTLWRPKQFLPTGRSCIDWDLPYSSYPFIHRSPGQPPLRILKRLRQEHERENRASRSPPILPPNASLHRPNPRNHPILAVLPNIRSPGNQATHFTEEEESGFAWPEHVSRSRLKKQRRELETQYQFHYEIGDHLFLWANNPLPDDPNGQFGRITQLDSDSDDEDFKESPIYKPLNYVREKPLDSILYGEHQPEAFKRILSQQLSDPLAQPQAGEPLHQADFDFDSFRETASRTHIAQSSHNTRVDDGDTSRCQPSSNMVQNLPAQIGPSGLDVAMISGTSTGDSTGANRTSSPDGDSCYDPNTKSELGSTSRERNARGAVVELQESNYQDLEKMSLATTPVAAHLTSESRMILDSAPSATLEDTIPIEAVIHVATSPHSDLQPTFLLHSLLPPVPLSPLNRLLEQMRYQCGRACSFLSCRLCLTFSYSTLIAPFVTCSPITLTNLICYPIRLSNVSAALSVPMIHHIMKGDHWGEVIAISSIREPDLTITVDIGFRFPDDALAMCVRDGIKFEGRYIRVQPIAHLHGTCFFPNITFSTTTSGHYALRSRCERLNAYLTLEEAVDANSPIITQMAELFTRLSGQLTLDPPGRSDSLKDHFPSILEAHTPLHAIHKILPPSKIPRTVFISRHISTSEISTSPQANLTALQEDELQFDHIIPNRPIPRRTRQQLVNRDSVDDPSSAAPMNARERFGSLRLVFKFATEKYRVWNLPTIPLSAPSVMAEGIPGEKLVKNLVNIWKWYDDAYGKVTSARDKALADPQSPFPLIEAYDAAVDAFSISTRRFGVYGAEYDALQEALLTLSHVKDASCSNESRIDTSDEHNTPAGMEDIGYSYLGVLLD
ncbi:hypothetical protein CPB86DRAFT_820467 [Serendipita vermifera]|nr:hypothetical protein CPB86DRAFT_820467 [Serendipita vermifera]